MRRLKVYLAKCQNHILDFKEPVILVFIVDELQSRHYKTKGYNFTHRTKRFPGSDSEEINQNHGYTKPSNQ